MYDDIPCDHINTHISYSHVKRQNQHFGDKKEAVGDKKVAAYFLYNCSYDISCNNVLVMEDFSHLKNVGDAKEAVGDKKVAEKYSCEICNYYTNKKSNYNKHIVSSKHTKIIYSSTNSYNDNYSCMICNKKFLSRNGLWLHKKKCESKKEKEEEKENNTKPSIDLSYNIQPNEIIPFLLQENKEFKQLLIEQNKTMMEIIANQPHVINNNIIQQNNNHNFNLNFFLNETCKDAMNINDFVKSLKIEPDDVEKFGKDGYVSGMTSLITKGLKALDITKRPIHCSDLKREVLHIKDGNNKWIKEIDVLIDALKKITNHNIAKIDDWKKANPGYDDYYNKLNDLFIMITMNSMGPTEKEEEEKDYTKIIKNISKVTLIDKNKCVEKE